MAKRKTSSDENTPATPRRRAKTTALPGPAEISIPVPVSEASDLSGGIARATPVEVPGFPPSPSASQIAQRAYELYAQEGYAHGRDVEHWLRAEQELKGGAAR